MDKASAKKAITKPVTYDTIKQWYNKKHSENGPHTWRPEKTYQYFYQLMTETDPRLKSPKGLRYLDVGFGTGYLLKIAQKAGLETYGIDISEESLRIASNITPESKLKVGNMENIEFEDSYFDFITCIGSLEHCRNMSQAFSEIMRVGKPDCKYLIVFPNENFLLFKFWNKFGTDQMEINEILISIRGWSYFLEKAGFRILHISKDLSIGNKYSGIKRTLANLLIKALPLQYTYQAAFHLEKL